MRSWNPASLPEEICRAVKGRDTWWAAGAMTPFAAHVVDVARTIPSITPSIRIGTPAPLLDYRLVDLALSIPVESGLNRSPGEASAARAFGQRSLSSAAAPRLFAWSTWILSR